MAELIPILLVILIATVFGSSLLFLASKLGPRITASALKKASYECGIEVQTTGHSKIPVKFYLTAILFILFDIEIIFMYPWAIAYGDFIDAGLGWYILGVMGVFLLIFIYGLFWEVKSKALEWE